MMNNQLEELSRVTRELEATKYPDAYRIAKEICEFSNFDTKQNNNILIELKSGKPWEYVSGIAYFRGLKLNVNEHTLIPRIESEQILEIIKPLISDEIEEIFDIGTGSGALAISLAKQYQDLKVKAIDISEKTLEVTKRNVETLKVSNVEIINSDLLEAVSIPYPSIIVANLPYIPTKEFLELDKSVKDFEPKNALDGGTDGLDLILRLLKQIKTEVNVKGAIFEIDPGQETKLTSLLVSNYKEFSFEFLKDFRGLVRFLKLYR